MATDYAPDKIRNVVLLGHSHDGKTTLAEAMLFASGSIARMGSPDQATATMDFEPEEHKRKISINLGVAFAEHNGYKINILDAPGFLDFAGQVFSGLRVAEGAVVVVGPGSQLAVGTEVAWEQCNRTNKPRIVVINKLDKENSDFYGAVAAMRENLSPRPFPLHLPIGSEQDFRGIVDLLHLKAFVTTPDGKGSEVPVPDDMQKLVEQYRGQLIEAAAESDDSLLEKYLDAGTLSEEEIQRGLREGILDGKVAPVVCCSATKLLGVRTLMSTIGELMPPPDVEPDKPTKAFVFSTGGDQFGKVSYFKVVSGTVKTDVHLPNLTRGGEERLAQIFFPRGKEHVATTEVKAGDIGAATKLAHTRTGDTLGMKDGGPLPGPGIQPRHHAHGARRRGKDLERPRPVERGGPDAPRRAPRGDPPARHRGPRRRASRRDAGKAEAEVRRRCHDGHPTCPLPGDGARLRACRGPARQAVRRPRPVRHLRDRGRAHRSRRRLRVGGQDLRRFDPAQLPALGAEGHRRQHVQGRGRRLPDGGCQGDADRRQVP